MELDEEDGGEDTGKDDGGEDNGKDDGGGAWEEVEDLSLNEEDRKSVV